MLKDNRNNKRIIAQTKKWVETVIIALNFCPFARPVLNQNSIHYAVTSAGSMPGQLESLLLELKRLDSHEDIETILLIFTKGLSDFEDFLDLLEMANALLADQNYEGTYQLASFHPDYRFAEVETDDPANYTNRSPHPTLHLIREKSIERALQSYPQPENIPERNIEAARQQGDIKMKALLAACYHPDKK